MGYFSGSAPDLRVSLLDQRSSILVCKFFSQLRLFLQFRTTNESSQHHFCTEKIIHVNDYKYIAIKIWWANNLLTNNFYIFHKYVQYNLDQSICSHKGVTFFVSRLPGPCWIICHLTVLTITSTTGSSLSLRYCILSLHTASRHSMVLAQSWFLFPVFIKKKPWEVKIKCALVLCKCLSVDDRKVRMDLNFNVLICHNPRNSANFYDYHIL